MKSWDVIIVGGGIIGLSLSIELRKRGATVLVVERGEPGREASWAAGGMLVDNPIETPPALQRLATASAQMYPEFARELEVESEKKVDLRDYGTLFSLSAKHIRHPDLRISLPHPAKLSELEPAMLALTPDQKTFNDQSGVDPQETALGAAATHPDFYFIQERSVDPRALSFAAQQRAKRRGVHVSSGEEVISVSFENSRVGGVITKKTIFHASKVVNCAGAWSGQILPHKFPTRPVKGQMLCLLSPARDLLKHVIRSSDVYLIPRSDGRIVVGTTVEKAGFDKRTEIATIQRLHQAAIALVPELRNARILEDWAGLRPGTPDGLPILGATSTPGYFVATGHFRDGILLAPITAHIMAKVVAGESPDYDLAAFSATRFLAAEAPDARASA
ncbi:MAG: glycine oxidase ThiO [Candidatus Sulfotelmatobacter sp.]